MDRKVIAHARSGMEKNMLLGIFLDFIAFKYSHVKDPCPCPFLLLLGR